MARELKPYLLIVAILLAGCSNAASPTADDIWLVTDLDREVARVMMTNGDCRTVRGTELVSTADGLHRLRLLSWHLFSDLGWKESDQIIIHGLAAAKINQSLDGYWLDHLTTTRLVPKPE